MQLLKSSKKLRRDKVIDKKSGWTDEIFFNYDLFSIIFLFFNPIEIVKFMPTNIFLYHYIKSRQESLQTIKKIIGFKFGDIFDSVCFNLPTDFMKNNQTSVFDHVSIF